MEIKKNYFCRTNYLQLALALYFTGALLAWSLQGLGILPRFYDIGVVLTLSFMLIFVALRGGFLLKRKLNYLVFMSFLIVVFIVLLNSLASSDSKVILFCFVFTISYFLFLNMASYKIKVGKIYIFFSTLLCCLFLFQVESLNMDEIGIGRVSVSEENAAYGFIAYCCVCSLAGYAHNAKFDCNGYQQFLLELAGISILLYIVILTGVRSPLFGCSFLIIYWFYQYARSELLSSPLRLVSMICLLCGMFLILSLWLSDSFFERLLHMGDTLYSGLMTISGSAVTDSASFSRVLMRGIGLDSFLSNPIQGSGYKSLWLDFPLLQAYSDLGILFGFLFMGTFLILPCLFSLRYINSSNAVGFFSLLYLANVPRLFLHGQPYDWQHFIYLVPIVAYMSNARMMTDSS
ncbi:hypothetical protein M0C34_18930 [Agarivorans sp. TSD2052]|uniref:hypothetical protein n=1 Tax=Agarivorans sp. TSD2052 TaxID=2937286 RepID=UPI00200BBB72|nr:hypothetical protein [Agarivorans sp. TSD2052]UPW18272.1 hypothetical protein M0C34_18930 [Agarivorans sp. TSD2052]